MPEDIPASLCPSDLRLRRHADYQRAYNASRKQHSREMSFFFARRDQMPPRRLHPDETVLQTNGGPRVGLTVGKVLGKAHDRNRIKRRLRAAVALHAGELSGLPMDVILHPRRSVLLLDWDTLQREVRQVFQAVRKGFHAPASSAGKRPAGSGRKSRRDLSQGVPAAGKQAE